VKHISPVKELHEFRDQDLIGGHPALDFVNTMTGRNGTPRDWLADPAVFATWAAKAGVLTDDESRRLVARYSGDPRAAKARLDRARALREAMYSCLDAAVRGVAPPAEVLDRIERAWRAAARDGSLQWNGNKGVVIVSPLDDFNVATNRIVLSFVDLGEKLSSDRLRKCLGDNCAWFFFDTSKAGRRRWCDMAVCGNAAKYVRARNVAQSTARSRPPD
jgi:predicted RNA-binding Zn ribbon-like protein